MDREDTLDTLKKLIETSKDGEYGFHTAAECVKADDTRQTLMRCADEFGQAAAELQSLVLQYGGHADGSGSVGAAMHRGWLTLKSKLSSHPDKTVLEEAEKNEDVALDRYRRALDATLPEAVRATIERQYEGVKRNHLQIRSLRDQARSMASMH
jgi:uncharacterized protein (TIGR02284 family)